MNNESCTVCNTPNSCGHKCQCGIKCISWSAIFIGAFIAIGLGFLLNLFSVSIGLSAYHLSASGAKTLAIGGVAGLAIGTIAIMFFAGWVAGFLGRVRCFNGNCGGLYGLSTWCVALILTIMLAHHVGRFVSSFNDFVENPTYATVRMTNNTAIVSTNVSDATIVTVNPDQAAIGSFVVFILFFLGAVASTWGGHCGLRSCCKKMSECQHSSVKPPVSL